MAKKYKIAVIGSGTMGNGIAHVCAQSGNKTLLLDINDNQLQDAISNRILMPMINEAIFCLEQNVATKEAIDGIMKLGMAHPMGPLELADFIGLDVCLDIMEVLWNGFNDSKYRPCALLKSMVSSGLLGKKTGKGFYTYD